MSDLPRTVLAVDDDPATREMVAELLEESGYVVTIAASGDDAIRMARETEFGVTLTDLHMPEMDGLQLLAALRELRPNTPVILMTAFGSIATAVKAMRAGALDYVTKPFNSESLLEALERAFERRDLEDESRKTHPATEDTDSFGSLVGCSPAMNSIYAMIRKIASGRSNVLITGESGTGKEVVARTIHDSGPRASEAFVPINCTAMPEGILESELFGHAKGAFTGAHADKRGLFVEANNGTIFLDEIGDLPLVLQGKLLRVLQEREIRPVGANRSVRVDARVIAATNRDLSIEIEEGRFREDLYYRLNVLPVALPPLRSRPEDIPLLAQAFLSKHSSSPHPVLTDEAMLALKRAPWKGNARELENSIERALALGDGGAIEVQDLLLDAGSTQSQSAPVDSLLHQALENRLSIHELTERYIAMVMEATGGRKGDAAQWLGINRRTLYRREERLASEGGAASDKDQ